MSVLTDPRADRDVRRKENMKRLKNNKGITGIDIVVSVTLIVITLGIVMAVYTSYANKTKEVKFFSVL